MSSFKELKERFKKQQEEKKKGGNNFTNSDIYPFWQMNDGEEAIVRILPDANTDNPNPFPISVEYKEHNISVNGKDIKIPSLENWGENDPIAELSQKYYKAGDKEKGKYYWRDKVNLLRALIIKDPLPPDETTGEKAEGKVKRLRFGFQLMETLLAQIASDDIENEPWDLENGFNFKIKKTAQGNGKSSYAIGSGFVRNASSIKDYNIELIDLKELLPANPGRDKVQRLLDSHLTGSDYTEDDTDNNDATNDKRTSYVTENKKPESANSDAAINQFMDNVTDDDDDDDDVIRKIKERRQQRDAAKKTSE